MKCKIEKLTSPGTLLDVCHSYVDRAGAVMVAYHGDLVYDLDALSKLEIGEFVNVFVRPTGTSMYREPIPGRGTIGRFTFYEARHIVKGIGSKLCFRIKRNGDDSYSIWQVTFDEMP